MTSARRLIRALAAAALAGPAMIVSCGARAQGIDLSHGGPIAITAREGIQWLQAQHEVIALGDARAVRQNVTVTADKLIAFYRKKPEVGQSGKPGATPAAASAQASAPPKVAPADLTATDDTSGSEIYRIEAEGHVVIFTSTDRAEGDRAVYDLDQAVLVMTGRHLRLTTPGDVLTARDDLEYWSIKHMAVARGNASVVSKDARRLAADILVAYTTPDQQQPGARVAAAAKPVAATQNTATDPLGATGKIERVDAFGHVLVSTPTEMVTGDRGVYVPQSGIAVLEGAVRITRGQNQLNGTRAQVDLKTGVSRLLPGRSGQVQGLIVPEQTPGAGQAPISAQGGAQRKIPGSAAHGPVRGSPGRTGS